MRKYLLLSICILLLFTVTNKITAQSIHITGPVGSGQFGKTVTVLSNGNYVVTDPMYDEGGTADVGAVYLYNGSTHALISTLKGGIAADQIGTNIYGLNNGNFVVMSPNWDNGAATNAGAVTFGNGTTGVAGVVSAANSLVGSTSNNQIGLGTLTILSNGNYVVSSPNWDNGAATDAGAVTFGNGTTGVIGVVSAANSLVGSTASDQVGFNGVTALNNSNYLVRNIFWDNGAATNAGALTFGNGTTGVAGIVSASNSLIGTTTNDQIASSGVTLLSNGNYVIVSPNWDNGIAINTGAVTFGNGATGVIGVVSAANSLVGSKANDQVGNGVTVLTNGNYVVRSPNWDNGAATDVGAITFCNGTTGVVGVVSVANSLIGTTGNDNIGSYGVAALSNGNFVVSSPNWDNGAATNAGAVTFGNGTTGLIGTVSVANSLVGSTSSDLIGLNNVFPLSNGNYVVCSQYWDNGAVTDAGAITYGNGTTGIVGSVSAANSLVGSTVNDNIGSNGATLLSNGNYVVRNPFWDNGAVTNAGAVTFGNANTGVVGVVNTVNSLVGSTASDQVGGNGLIALNNGNYVASSQFWDNGTATDAGAVTFGNGTTGVVGVVSAANSLVGSTVNDNVGSSGVITLSNGNYLIRSLNWDNGAVTNAGAVTFGNGTTGAIGLLSAANSLVGTTTSDQVGSYSVTRLSNGNYLVNSPFWDNGTATDAGAVTFGNGATGVVGVVSATNSLVGSTANDYIGNYGVTALSNGNYVLRNLSWDNGAATDAGAVTFGNGITGVVGVVSAANSLVGSTVNDNIGSNGVTSFSNGNYVISSPYWNNGAATDAGAITIGNSAISLVGAINNCNSVLGTVASGGFLLNFQYNSGFDYLIVGRPSENIVTIYDPVGMALANNLDIATTNINGLNKVPLVVATGCRIIAALTPNGGAPVAGTVNAKAWIEPSIPTYGGKPFVARHYEITPVTNPSTSTGRVTLYFAQQEFTDFNAHPGSIDDLPANPGDATGKANLRIAKYGGGTNNGSGLPGSYTSGATIIDPVDADIVWNNSLSRWEVSFDVTGFSGFIVQTNTTVLPLSLLDFNGRLVNSYALLNWKTENEQNTSNFEIERSVDGINYTTAGMVAAANQSGVHQYNFTDNNVSALGVSVLYYRLKQIDIDGRFTYSRIVVLTLDNNRNLVLFYPNPVINEANVTISTAKSGLVQARIIDNIGRVVKQLQWNVIAGSNSYSINVSGLTKGMYYLEIKGEMINERSQFVKQ